MNRFSHPFAMLISGNAAGVSADRATRGKHGLIGLMVALILVSWSGFAEACDGSAAGELTKKSNGQALWATNTGSRVIHARFDSGYGQAVSFDLSPGESRPILGYGRAPMSVAKCEANY